MARQVTVEIAGNAKGFSKATEDAVHAGNKLHGAMLGIAAGIGLGLFNAAVGAIEQVTGAVKASDQIFRDDQSSLVLLGQTLKDNIKGWDGTNTSLERYVSNQGRLGFSAIQVRDALGQLIGVTHDVRKATEALALAQDFARAHHLDLATAVDIVSKAHAGNAKALRVYGISIPPVTAAMDALHASHLKITPAMHAHAVAVDKAATAVKTLAAMHAQAKGAAEAYANTAQGKLEAAQAINQESWVKIGAIVDRVSSVVLPMVARAFSVIADYVTANVNPTIAKAVAVFNQVKVVALELWNAFMQLLAPALKIIKENIGGIVPALKLLGLAIVVVVVVAIAIIALLVAAIIGIVAGIIWVVSNSKKWWDQLMAFLHGLPGRITAIAANMWMGIWNAFRAMLNMIIGAWNSLSFHIPSILGSPAVNVNLPHIPSFALGGTMPYTGLAMLHKGETVTPAGGGGNQLHIHIDRGAFIDGPSIDRLANLILQRARYAPGR